MLYICFCTSAAVTFKFPCVGSIKVIFSYVYLYKYNMYIFTSLGWSEVISHLNQFVNGMKLNGLNRSWGCRWSGTAHLSVSETADLKEGQRGRWWWELQTMTWCQTKPLMKKTKLLERTLDPAQHCDYVPYEAYSDPINLTQPTLIIHVDNSCLSGCGIYLWSISVSAVSISVCLCCIVHCSIHKAAWYALLRINESQTTHCMSISLSDDESLTVDTGLCSLSLRFRHKSCKQMFKDI